MLHVASTFENSLRREVSSPLPKKHTSCKGTAHGSGNYGLTHDKECDLDHNHSPFQRNNSKRWSRRSSKTSESETLNASGVEKSPFQRNSSGRCESDSLDSLGDNKAKGSDTIDEANKKGSDASSRLFNNLTKSSIAKTAKMRHLDIFDVDDNSWIGGLRKTTEEISKLKLPSEAENPFNRSRNDSLRRKSNETIQESKPPIKESRENGFSKSKNGTFRKTEDKQAQGTFPRIPARNSFRKGTNNKKLAKMKCFSYEEILFMSNYKKAPGFFNVVDKNDCFKDFDEIVKNKEEEVSFCRFSMLYFQTDKCQ
ncbi:hypothetical protein JTB14_034810 [Gonioctena quinquepunctata]|nr:hypothetical protein JTB14_034810 [Gonioctena quinquepunctata]